MVIDAGYLRSSQAPRNKYLSYHRAIHMRIAQESTSLGLTLVSGEGGHVRMATI